MFNSRHLRITEAALVLLFFIQALRATTSLLLGHLHDRALGTFVPELLLVAVTLAAPLLAPRRHVRLGLVMSAICVAIARPALSGTASTHYWPGLAVLAAGGIYLAGLVRNRPRAVVTGLAGALVIDQLLRALGHTHDPSMDPALLLPVSLLGLALVLVSALLFAAHPEELITSLEPPGTLSFAGGLALGAALFVETSLLALPNALASWSDFEYAVIAPALVAVTCFPLLTRLRRRSGRIISGSHLVGVGLIGVALVGLAAGHARSGALSALGLLLAHGAVLAALLQTAESNPAQRPERVGLWLAIGLWLALALYVALSLTFLSPLMRGMGLSLYLVASFIATQAAVTCRGSEPPVPERSEYRPLARNLMVTAIFTVLSIVAAFPPTVPDSGGVDPLTAVVYVHSPDSHHGCQNDLDRIATTLEQVNADIILLPEADTGRPVNCGVDDVIYLARRLRMKAAYLPVVERMVGVAVLHRLPELERDAKVLAIPADQAGVLHVHLAPGGRELHVYGVRLDSHQDAPSQIEQIAALVDDDTSALLGGGPGIDPENSDALRAQAGFEAASWSLPGSGIWLRNVATPWSVRPTGDSGVLRGTQIVTFNLP